MTRPDPSRLGLPPFVSQCLTIAGAALAGAGVAAVGVPAGWLSGAMMGTAWIGFAIVEALAIIGIALAFVL